MPGKSLNYKTVLFLEDNISFAEHTIRFLELYVKDVFHCTSIKGGLELFDKNEIDFIISDLKVDDGIALSFIEQIRSMNKTIPIVVLSAHKDEEFLLKSIPLGLTAYEIKPISFITFKALLKKCAASLELDDVNILLVKNNIFYDFNKKLLIKDSVDIKLSQKEALFIELLIKNKNRIITKEDIEDIIWEEKKMSDSALKNFLLRIRKKVGKDFLFTIQNVGYRL